ncbi:MAG: macro domain-containing protein [Caldisericota bacterium]|nr:macro domain-containing protein [Caldisericota bacterium]
MVHVVIGEIFDSRAQTIVNTVNCVGVMGKGLALGFRQRYPEMYSDYVDRCSRGEVHLGEPYVYRYVVPPWILLFPTKQHWRSLSRLVDIDAGLSYLVAHYRDWGITSLAVPPLGCGLGGLDWSIVGPTLYQGLSNLDIDVKLYAPTNTPAVQLAPAFLDSSVDVLVAQEGSAPERRITPDYVVLVEIVHRLENMSYHWPIGRVMFQKIGYFATTLGVDTGLAYTRGSYGPFAPRLRLVESALLNNGLLTEKWIDGRSLISTGPTYADAVRLPENRAAVDKYDQQISKVVDLVCRMNTRKAEVAATVHFVAKELHKNSPSRPTEVDVLRGVIAWKERRRPALDRVEVAVVIRNLASLGWIDVSGSQELSQKIELELGLA